MAALHLIATPFDNGLGKETVSVTHPKHFISSERSAVRLGQLKNSNNECSNGFPLPPPQGYMLVVPL